MITKLIDIAPIFGTSFYNAAVFASLNELEEALGIDADYLYDDKVTFEFDLQLEDGTPFTIYDWKEDFLTPTERIFYHIGTRNQADSEKVCQVLRDEYGFEASVGAEYSHFLTSMMGGN